jgi:UDP-N-acetylglucosamine--N-acetylmuramyl-(pentapeptide) pyrophosphoryl-undecaprenol N-acetylglucosamine transferase
VNVVIAGGGTAGHVNPAIALGRALADASVTFIGTKTGAEARLVPAAGFSLEMIEVKGFDRSRPLSIFKVGTTAAGAIGTARKLLKRLRPDVVVGMGGYVALPVVLAARLGHIPIVIHEQNSVFGLTNRICRRVAKRVAVSFEETLEDAGPKGIRTGNPVLPELAHMDRTAERKAAVERFDLDEGRKTLLVFGGSQGARRINQAVPGLVSLWSDESERQILHISGSSAATQVEDAGESNKLIYRRVDFVERMQEPYAVADLALVRGGATTVAELGAVGLPALVVPYPYHRDKQQERHGRALERAGAARVILDDETTPERVAAEAQAILDDAELLEKMRTAARSAGNPDAAGALADVVREAAA